MKQCKGDSMIKIILFLVLTHATVVFSAESCHDLQACRNMIEQAKKQIAHLSSENKKLTVNGSVFIKDNTQPALGNAYRDPGGTIWGDVGKINGVPTAVELQQAKDFCQSNGFRLPTVADFKKLANFLGYVVADANYGEKKYSPFAAETSTTVLPYLEKTFWTADALPASSPDPGVYVFNGATGFIYEEDHFGDNRRRRQHLSYRRGQDTSVDYVNVVNYVRCIAN